MKCTWFWGAALLIVGSAGCGTSSTTRIVPDVRLNESSKTAKPSVLGPNAMPPIISTPPATAKVMSHLEAVAYNMVIEQVRKNASHIEAYMLTTRSNPHGTGVFVYRPLEPQNTGKTLSVAAVPMWLVVDGHAYALTEVAQQVTPSLKLSTTAPHKLWEQTNTADKVGKHGITPALAFKVLHQK